MGTSGAYGGSAKQVWKDARQQVLDLPGGGGGDQGDSQDQAGDQALDALWSQIADALGSDDPSLYDSVPDDGKISLPVLMPWLRTSGGGSGAGAGGQIRTGGGRQGSRSRREVTRSAARGGAALGAAYAIRAGDAAYLDELGLDLTRLQGLSAARQCAEILDAILGEGAHPDELALRKASLEALKEVLIQDEPPDETSSLRLFVVSYVFELSLVELQRQVSEGATSPSDVARKERTIRTYLEKRVRTIPIPGRGAIQPSELRSRAAQLTQEVIKLLRAGVGGTV